MLVTGTSQSLYRKQLLPQMTTDISGCVDNVLPEFPWEDLEDLWSGEFPPANVELGTGRNGFGQANNCPISQCSNLVPIVDIPLTPPLNQQSPSYEGTTKLSQMSLILRPQ